MKFTLAGEIVQIEGLTPAAVAAFSLVQYHAPTLVGSVIRAAGKAEAKRKDIDLAPSFKPAEQVNQDRAQLAKLGG